MRYLSTAYLSEIERYTQCHENHQQIYQFCRQVSADLIRGISETRPWFKITLETERGEPDSNGENALNANSPQRAAILDLGTRPVQLDRKAVDSALADSRPYYPWAT